MDRIVIKETEKNRRIKIIGLIIGVFLVILSIKARNWKQLLIGGIFLYFTVYKKENIITKNGIINTHKGIFFKRKEELEFATLDSIIIYKTRDGKYVFYFDRKENAKGIKVEEEYFKPIINLIESGESKVRIEYVTEPIDENR